MVNKSRRVVTRYPIYLNYDMDTAPIGFVEIDSDIEEKILQDGAVVPYLLKKSTDANFEVVAFGLVDRTAVDTRPR